MSNKTRSFFEQLEQGVCEHRPLCPEGKGTGRFDALVEGVRIVIKDLAEGLTPEKLFNGGKVYQQRKEEPGKQTERDGMSM